MKFAALDTRFLIRLEHGDEGCGGAIDDLQTLGFFCIVTESVLQELSDYAELGSSPELRSLAESALGHLRGQFNVLDPTLNPLQHGYAERFAEKLIESNLLDGATKNDGLVLAEAGFNNAKIFVTDRSMFMRVDYRKLAMALIESDIPPVLVFSPTELRALAEALKARMHERKVPAAMINPPAAGI